ncbi:hypothetical protein [Propionibacterium acidifaciens]|uniref:hypothetical protein n=1 Tax=Propionibacterium acidifaciens TaxID=556499 RepID=UPI0003F737C3|nr:hypothetical protein [Propionibacterium acidifaciens]
MAYLDRVSVEGVVILEELAAPAAAAVPEVDAAGDGPDGAGSGPEPARGRTRSAERARTPMAGARRDH